MIIVIFIILGIYLIPFRANLHGIEKATESFHKTISNTLYSARAELLEEEGRRDFLIITRKLRNDFEREIIRIEELLSVLSQNIAEIYYQNSKILKGFRTKNSIVNHWLSSEFKGKMKGRIDGRIMARLNGSLKGNLDAALQGRLAGTIKARVKGKLSSEFKGTVDGEYLEGPLKGMVDSDLDGYLAGNVGTPEGNRSVSPGDTWIRGEFKGSFRGNLSNWLNASFNGSIDGFLFARIQGSIKGDLSERLQQVQLLLEGLYETTPNLMWIYFISREGFFAIFPRSAYYQGDVDPKQQDWFHKCKNNESEAAIIEEIDKDQWEGGQLVLRFSRSVRDFDGQFIGCLGIDVDIGAFYREMKNRLVSTGYDAFLIEPSRKIVFPRKLQEEWVFLLFPDGVRENLNPKKLEKLIRSVLRGEGGDTTFAIRGKNHYLSLYPLVRTGMILGMTAPYRAIKEMEIQKSIEGDILSMRAMVRSLSRSGYILVLFLGLIALIWLGTLVLYLAGKHLKKWKSDAQ